MAPVSFFKVNALPSQLVADAIYFVRKSPGIFEIVVTNSQGVALSQEPAQDGEDGIDGEDGANGLSAYQLAQSVGYVGSLEDWLASLIGPGGASAYELAIENGFVGNVTDWLASLKGEDGEPGVNGIDAKAGFSVRPVSGRFVSQGSPLIYTTTANVTGNRARMMPFAFDRNIQVTEASFVVNTASAVGGTANIAVYALDENGVSATRVFLSPTFAVDTAGNKIAPFAYTFEAGKVYFAGVVCNNFDFNARISQVNAGYLTFGHSTRNQANVSGCVLFSVPSAEFVANAFATPVNDPAVTVFFTMA